MLFILYDTISRIVKIYFKASMLSKRRRIAATPQDLSRFDSDNMRTIDSLDVGKLLASSVEIVSYRMQLFCSHRWKRLGESNAYCVP